MRLDPKGSKIGMSGHQEMALFERTGGVALLAEECRWA